ncbi:hypothetical protein [Algoriphagus winogradskyi]|uniref:Lipoprotein n=1 Tax=Algoriphagus winogradskyi TaxID=237017 RepID=A0ABY1PML6_9BACT|nr:hypothetical protein [Algoriphagus winogradskyi]SMP36336.1 hypothetical protein SAMN06265367_11337 [Algoriphagus winogradskyi]
MKLQHYPLLVFSLMILSITSGCNSNSRDTSTSEPDTYELVKIDSFQVDNFTRVNILDYNPSEKRYLGYSINEDDIVEISESGEILNRAHRKGDGPSNYGNWNPIGLGFGPEGQRIVELPFELISYDKNYEIVKRLRIPSPLPVRANTPFGSPPYFQSNDTTFLLVGPSNYFTATYLIHNQEGKDTLQNFYQLNLQTGAIKTVVPYEGNSIYNATENIYPELMGKSFFIDHKNNELVLVQNLDTELLVYDLPGMTLKKSIPITHSEFLTYPPVPVETAFSDERAIALGRLSARNQKLFNMGDHTYLLQYFTGISQSEYDSRTTEEEPYLGRFDNNEQRIVIFKNGKQVSKELLGINGTIVLSLPGQKLLVQEPENSEIEEEFTRFSIYQLQSN